MIVLSVTVPLSTPQSFFKHIHAFLASREARIHQLLILAVSTIMHTSEFRAATVGRYVHGDAYAEHKHIDTGHTEQECTSIRQHAPEHGLPTDTLRACHHTVSLGRERDPKMVTGDGARATRARRCIGEYGGTRSTQDPRLSGERF